MKKINLTLYTTLTGNPDTLISAITTHFQSVTRTCSFEGKNFYLLLQDGSEIRFYPKNREEQPEFMNLHLEGMIRYFTQQPSVNANVQENIVRQISLFDSLTGIVFDTDENQDRTDFILNTLFAITETTKGLLLYPNKCLYNGKGMLVLSGSEKSELETAEIASPSADDPISQARRQRSLRILQEQGITAVSSFPLLPDSTLLKSREEMVKRATALFAVALYAEILLSEQPDREEALFYLNKMDELYNIKNDLTPFELAYINLPDPSRETCIQYAWRYECCGVLLWAAGTTEELPYPSEICDIPIITGIFWQHKSITELLSIGVPRTSAEILDTADLTLCYESSCVNSRRQNQPAPASLDEGIVMERAYTFTWLTGINAPADWDHIQLNF